METPKTTNPSTTQCSENQSYSTFDNRSGNIDRDEGNDVEVRSQFGIQNKELSNLYSNHTVPQSNHSLPQVDQTNCVSYADKDCVACRSSDVPVFHMKLDHLEKLKNSTKKLLCLLEDVQEKTHSTAPFPDDPPKLSTALKPMTCWDSDNCDNFMDRSVADIIGASAMKRLEKQAKELDAIIIKDEDDDCSVYKRLTRKCHCLNQKEYNDFIIHFNEETKFCTNTIGEIIKNMRIIKKFLYMGGEYTKNALLFLNQGLEEGTQAEKAEIAQSCAFADLCCIFEPHTMVTVCISWPCKSPSFMEPVSQEMAAEFLHNLAKIEEGRRYLNFNSKITCDIKKVLKKKQDKINYDTIELLNSVLALCETPVPRLVPQSITYQCRPTEEAMGNKTLNALMSYRRFMTTNELFFHLDILKSLSGNEETKMELTPHLPAIIALFKNMLLEFNNSDMNCVIANIMNNILGCNEQGQKSDEKPPAQTFTVCIATETVKQKNENTQVPYSPKKSSKKHYAHHPRHYSRHPIVIKKKDVANKHVKPQQKSNANQKSFNQQTNEAPRIPNAACNARKEQPSVDDGLRTKSLPFWNNVKRSKWEPSVAQLKEYAYIRSKSATPVFTTLINRSRKFMGGDNKNVIVVPMDERRDDAE